MAAAPPIANFAKKRQFTSIFFPHMEALAVANRLQKPPLSPISPSKLPIVLSFTAAIAAAVFYAAAAAIQKQCASAPFLNSGSGLSQ